MWARLLEEAGLSRVVRPRRLLYRLLALALAGGITRVARGLALGLECELRRGGGFLFAHDLGGCFCRGLLLARLLLGLGGLARKLGLGPFGGLRLALGAAFGDLGIVEARLGLKLLQDILPCFLRRLLSVCEARFLESTH